MFAVKLECPVCLEKYRLNQKVPHILKECGHTLCAGCITNEISRNSRPVVVCPICRQSTNGHSISDYPKNYSIIECLENAPKSLEQYKEYKKLLKEADLTASELLQHYALEEAYNRVQKKKQEHESTLLQMKLQEEERSKNALKVIKQRLTPPSNFTAFSFFYTNEKSKKDENNIQDKYNEVLDTLSKKVEQSLSKSFEQIHYEEQQKIIKEWIKEGKSAMEALINQRFSTFETILMEELNIKSIEYEKLKHKEEEFKQEIQRIEKENEKQIEALKQELSKLTPQDV